MTFFFTFTTIKNLNYFFFAKVINSTNEHGLELLVSFYVIIIFAKLIIVNEWKINFPNNRLDISNPILKAILCQQKYGPKFLSYGAL